MQLRRACIVLCRPLMRGHSLCACVVLNTFFHHVLHTCRTLHAMCLPVILSIRRSTRNQGKLHISAWKACCYPVSILGLRPK